MLLDIRGHLIDKSEVVYVSPVEPFFNYHPWLRCAGARFVIRFKGGKSVTIEDVDFADSREEFKEIVKNRYNVADALELERDKLK